MKELVYHRQLLPTADRLADKPAFFDEPYEATYGEHVDRVLRLADGLRGELGIGRDERFAVMALNGHQFLELYHAAFLGAGVINPLNLRLAPKELAFILGDSDTKVCFTDAPFAPLIDAVRAEAGIEQVVLIGEGDVPHDVRYEDLLAAGEPVVPEEPEEDDPVVLMYTGGTTGLPKGVLLDQRAEMLNMYHVADAVAASTSAMCTCTRRRCSMPRRWAGSWGCRPRAACRRSCRCSSPGPCSTRSSRTA